MGEIFLKLLNMSLAASWLMAVAVFLSLTVRRVPRWIVCLLWGLVAVRLICPFSVENPFSVVPSDEVIPEGILSSSQRTLEITTGVGPVDAAVNGYLGDTYHEGTSVPYDYGNILMSKMGAVWLCGFAGLLLYAVVMDLRLRRKLREAVLLRGKVYLCDHVGSPFVFGFFRPRIYLPSDRDRSDMGYVVAHEKAHLRRGDHIWKAVAFLLLSVYWFHPLSWAAFLLFCRDLELACDERVVRNLGMTERKAYAESLLSCSSGKKVSVAYLLSFGEVGVKKRVKSILNYRKPGFWVAAVSLLACVIIGIGFLTTMPRERQAAGEISEAENARIQFRRTEAEIKQMLLDYDRESIGDVVALLYEDENGIKHVHLLVEGRDETPGVEEQDEIKDLVSEHLDLDAQNISLICVEAAD